MFDPELGKEYEYSNDLNLESDDDDDEEKEKTCLKILKYYWKTIKNILKNIFISPIKYLIEYDHRNNIKEV